MTSTNFNLVPPIIGVVHGEKVENFGVVDFKCWQQKMLFNLTILNLTNFSKMMIAFYPREKLTKKNNLQWMHGNMWRISLQELHLEWIGQHTV